MWFVAEGERVLVARWRHRRADAAHFKNAAADGDHNAGHGGEGGESAGHAAGDEPPAEAERDGKAEHSRSRYEVAASG